MVPGIAVPSEDRKSTRLNSSHVEISYAVFCLKKKNLRQRDRHHRPLRIRDVRSSKDQGGRVAADPGPAPGERRGRGKAAEEGSQRREEAPLGTCSPSPRGSLGSHFLRSCQAEAIECVLKDDPRGVHKIETGIPQRPRLSGQDGAITIELVELSREVRSERGDGVNAASLGALPQSRREFRDPP